MQSCEGKFIFSGDKASSESAVREARSSIRLASSPTLPRSALSEDGCIKMKARPWPGDGNDLSPPRSGGEHGSAVEPRTALLKRQRGRVGGDGAVGATAAAFVLSHPPRPRRRDSRRAHSGDAAGARGHLARAGGAARLSAPQGIHSRCSASYCRPGVKRPASPKTQTPTSPFD